MYMTATVIHIPLVKGEKNTKYKLEVHKLVIPLLELARPTY